MGRLWRVAGIGAAALVVAGLLWSPTQSQPPRAPLPWKTGYWIWAGEPPADAKSKPDLLYVQVSGSLWPEDIPEASAFVVVRRLEVQTPLTPQMADALGRVYAEILQKGPRSIVGLQIDYDCPTSRLEEYADFLEELHAALPPDTFLSITALLDWFRRGTRIRDVVDSVDEFVPQFYDAGPNRAASGIAQTIDVEKWAPLFNELGVPYRIGISSFGRIARRRGSAEGAERVMYFRDASPLAFALRRDLDRSTEATTAGELVVHYQVDAADAARSGLHSELASGDIVDVTFPTARSVRGAYSAVQRFGGYCAGALFFRWPNRSESLSFTADEISEILAGDTLSPSPELEARNGGCPSRRCTDLYLRLGSDPATPAQQVRIRAKGTVDLFLPEGPLRPQWSPAGELFVSLPAHSGLRSVYLGRAFSQDPIQFEVVVP